MPAVPAMIGQEFAYAFGRTGVLQQLLLSQSDVDRMLGAHDRKDTEKILTELKLTSMIDQGIHKGEEILRALGAWVRSEVETMSPAAKRPVFQILWLNGDAPLLSYLLKQHHGLTSAISTEPPVSMNAYSPEALKALVETGKDATMPDHLVTFVQEVRNKADLSPQDIDDAVAAYIASIQLRLARASGSSHILAYVRHSIDLTNIRTALRAYDEDVRFGALVEGGHIAPGQLRGGHGAVLKAVGRSDYYHLAASIEKVADDPIALERSCNDILATDIANMWNVPLSIEPLFAFAAIALSNTFLIRSILIGKGNGLSPQEMKQILPPFIPASHYIL